MGDQGLDTLGVPLFDNEKMMNIWETQKKHVQCIQDPEGVSLYTQTGTCKKGDVVLPKYRCARGSVSLESFHNHLAKFIPGIHFQFFINSFEPVHEKTCFLLKCEHLRRSAPLFSQQIVQSLFLQNPEFQVSMHSPFCVRVVRPGRKTPKPVFLCHGSFHFMTAAASHSKA